jgi:hypothetical protein
MPKPHLVRSEAAANDLAKTSPLGFLPIILNITVAVIVRLLVRRPTHGFLF